MATSMPGSMRDLIFSALFFQPEDGIRDIGVTGVQTCALPISVLQFGDDTARGLGVRLAPTQTAVVLLAVGLVAFAVSAAGPITFVALVVPQIAVRLAGGSRPPLLASGLLGGLLVVGADLVTRTVLPEALDRKSTRLNSS